MNAISFGTINWIENNPKNWKSVKLKNIFVEHYKKNLKKDMNILSLSYGKTRYRDLSNNFGLLPESFETYNLIKPGHLVFRLTDLQNDKKSLRVGLNQLEGAITSAYTVIKTNKTEQNIGYYSYLLKSFDFLKFIYNLGGGVRQGANFNDLKNVVICCPPFSQQTAITNYLDNQTTKIDKEISILEQKLEKLDEYKQSLIYKTVTKGLDKNVSLKDSGIEWIGMIPTHWEVKRVKDFYKLGMGETILKEDLIENGKYPIYSATAEDKFFGYLNELNNILKKGDLVVGARGTIGSPKLVKRKMGCTQTTIYLKTKNKILSKYTYYYLLGLSSDIFFYDQTAVPQLTVQQLNRKLVLLPSQNEQQQIAEYLDEQCLKIDKKKELINKKVELLKEYKQSLIYEAVTGKINVGEYNE